MLFPSPQQPSRTSHGSWRISIRWKKHTTLMEEIPNNHLGCIKHYHEWDTTYQLVSSISEPSTVQVNQWVDGGWKASKKRRFQPMDFHVQSTHDLEPTILSNISHPWNSVDGSEIPHHWDVEKTLERMGFQLPFPPSTGEWVYRISETSTVWIDCSKVWRNNLMGLRSSSSWWFQPIWKILVKLNHFPR